MHYEYYEGDRTLDGRIVSNVAGSFNYSAISIYHVIFNNTLFLEIYLCFNSDFRNTTERR
jgi:hypothetical protein